MFDLTVFEGQKDVICTEAKVSFPAFATYKEQAVKFAEYVRGIEVTEDTVADVKKDLAKVRKVTDGLNKRRIALKKELMAEFITFENQVKELVSIIDDADEEVRAKVRELEELERQYKESQIRELWDARCWAYPWLTCVKDAFHRFLKPEHLNKSKSIKSVEADMVNWMETKDKEYSTLEKMGKEYAVEFLSSLNLQDAIAKVTERHEIQEELPEVSGEDFATAVFMVTGEKDIILAEMLMKDNNINYTKNNF